MCEFKSFCAEKSDDLDRAKKCLLAALKLQPSRTKLYLKMFGLCAKMSKKLEAQTHLQKALYINPRDLYSRYLLTNIQIENCDMDSAYSNLEYLHRHKNDFSASNFYFESSASKFALKVGNLKSAYYHLSQIPPEYLTHDDMINSASIMSVFGLKIN